MRVTIIGTGNMARALSVRALAGGHQVELLGTHISDSCAPPAGLARNR